MGHEQGDALITGIAAILKSHRSERIQAYRIGGDEFVVFMSHSQEGEVEELIKTIREEVATAKLEYDLRLSVAI